MKIKSHDLSQTLKGYSSKWVALRPLTAKVVAVGMSPKIVLEKARESGIDNPILTRVPKNYGTYIL